MSDQQRQHIHLIGNSSENFYTLGKRDKNSFTQVYDHISMLCMRNNLLAKIVKTTTEFSSRFTKKQSHYILEDLAAYAEGLARPFEDVLFAQLLPEMVASFNKWSPDLLSLVPGCSSYFYWDKENKGVIHTRLLDYALSGPFESYERSILYELPKRYKVFSYSSTGLSLPGLSAMNEMGLTLALHYKHSDYFNQEGDSIFFLASQILYECANVQEALKFLRGKKSISFWGIYLSDPSGEVLSFDICGSEYSLEKFDLKDHEFLYFNNRSILKKVEQEKLQPFGNRNQCSMRYRSVKAQVKLDRIHQSKNKMLEILKEIGTPKALTSNSAKNWNLPVNTPSTIQFYNFHNKNFESYFVKGSAPKFFSKDLIHYKDIFSKISITESHNEKKSSKLYQGYHKLALYQSYLDKNEIPEAYHEIQMAIELFKGHPEQYIAKFYFYITEYLFEADQRDLAYLYQDFLELEDKLPDYLNDQRILFLLRLGKLLGHEVEHKFNAIKNVHLKELYQRELTLNSLSIRGLKYLTFPRIEILDVIYAY